MQRTSVPDALDRFWMSINADNRNEGPPSASWEPDNLETGEVLHLVQYVTGHSGNIRVAKATQTLLSLGLRNILYYAFWRESRAPSHAGVLSLLNASTVHW
jgi:hypothetical protein